MPAEPGDTRVSMGSGRQAVIHGDETKEYGGYANFRSNKMTPGEKRMAADKIYKTRTGSSFFKQRGF